MTIIFHIVIALTYAALAAVVTFALPNSTAAVEPTLAMVVGGTVLLTCAAAHGFISQYVRSRRVSAELQTVARATAGIQRGLAETRGALHELRQSANRQNDGLAPEDTGSPYREVVGEIRMLRTLLGQLSPGSPKRTTDQRDIRGVPEDDDVLTLGGGEESTMLDDDETVFGYAPEPVAPKSSYRAAWAEDADRASQRPSGPIGGLAQRAEPMPRFGEVAAPHYEDDEILDLMRDALERARVSLYLQPIVQLPTRKVAFYEAFSRIKDSDGNVILPGSYIEAAERSGLITAIDNNLLFRCVQLVRRVRRHNKSYPFFCNVSPHTLRDTAFFPQFVEFLGENMELASDMIFEFHEPDVGIDYDDFAENLEQLAELGFRFSLDHLSRLDLNYGGLARRHFRFVKVDTGTLLELIKDDAGIGQFTALQDEMLEAGISLIVEKMETERELVELLDYRADFGQGYLFGEPRESLVRT